MSQESSAGIQTGVALLLSSMSDLAAAKSAFRDGVMQSMLANGVDLSVWSADRATLLAEGARTTLALAEDVIRDFACEFNKRNPVNRLPIEVLCRTFAFLPHFRHVTAASSVCRHWRSVALEHATLWTNIRVGSYQRFGRMDSRFDRLHCYLSRTKLAPIDLFLHYLPHAVDEDAPEPLQAHIGHIRDMDINLPYDALLRWRVTFSMPANLLMTLSLAVPLRPAMSPPDAQVFPFDLFSGSAPCLETLKICNLDFPERTWALLPSIRRLYVHRRRLMGPELICGLRIFPNLKFLSVTAEDFFQDDVPASSDDFEGPTTIELDLGSTTTENTEYILNNMPYPDPRHMTVVFDDSVPMEAIQWLTSSIVARELYCRSLLLPRDDFAFILRAQDGEGGTRTTKLRGHQLRNLTALDPLFPALRMLTITEELWPADAERRPALPQLERLTVIFDNPLMSHLMNKLGVFHLDLRDGLAWHLPALRTLRIAFKAEDAAAASVEANPVGLIISAHDVVTLLKWHLRTDKPVKLMLQNVSFLEAPDCEDIRWLEAATEQLVVEPDFVDDALEPEPTD